MPLVALQTPPNADPFAAVRALNRMHRAGFSLTVRADKLVVSPANRLSDAQRATIHTHKPALVALLRDAEVLLENLTLAGPTGLGWMEGTPGWTGERLLASGEVLYASGQMVNRDGRRYLAEHAPAPAWRDDAPTSPVEPPDSRPLPGPLAGARTRPQGRPGAPGLPLGPLGRPAGDEVRRPDRLRELRGV